MLDLLSYREVFPNIWSALQSDISAENKGREKPVLCEDHEGNGMKKRLGEYHMENGQQVRDSKSNTVSHVIKNFKTIKYMLFSSLQN